jgi:hypothetical protein
MGLCLAAGHRALQFISSMQGNIPVAPVTRPRSTTCLLCEIESRSAKTILP